MAMNKSDYFYFQMTQRVVILNAILLVSSVSADDQSMHVENQSEKFENYFNHKTAGSPSSDTGKLFSRAVEDIELNNRGMKMFIHKLNIYYSFYNIRKSQLLIHWL